MKLVVVPAALDELREAAVFYAANANVDLGLAFVAEFERAANTILANPNIGAPFRGTRRRSHQPPQTSSSTLGAAEVDDVTRKRKPPTECPRSSPRELLPGLVLQCSLDAGQSFTQCKGFRVVRRHTGRSENVFLERFDQLRGMRDESDGSNARLPRGPVFQRRQNDPELIAQGADFPSLLEGSPTPSFARRVVHMVSHEEALCHRLDIGGRSSPSTERPKVTSVGSVSAAADGLTS